MYDKNITERRWFSLMSSGSKSDCINSPREEVDCWRSNVQVSSVARPQLMWTGRLTTRMSTQAQEISWLR